VLGFYRTGNDKFKCESNLEIFLTPCVNCIFLITLSITNIFIPC
jgi:hypothetical protein